MASEQTIKDVVKRLLLSPLANKPKPLPGQDERKMINELVNIYLATLQDIPDDLLMVATIQYLTTEKWFPAVSDLRAAAVYLINRADEVPDAYTAWGQVLRAIRGSTVELHPLAHQAINALGGLHAFGQSQVDDEGQWRARFISAYETYQRRQVEDAMMLPQIAGYIKERRELNGNSVAGLIEATAERLRK